MSVRSWKDQKVEDRRIQSLSFYMDKNEAIARTYITICKTGDYCYYVVI